MKFPSLQIASNDSQVWIDVLLSAGVPVEVCKVKAKDAEASCVAMDRLSKKRKASLDTTPNKMKADTAEEWSGPEDHGEEEDEWKYESGEEGKNEGH